MLRGRRGREGKAGGERSSARKRAERTWGKFKLGRVVYEDSDSAEEIIQGSVRSEQHPHQHSDTEAACDLG